MSEYLSRYKTWLASDKTDAETKAELKLIQDDDNEIKERFTSYLEFGTAGLRGRMVAGTNAMNVYTVMHATQGLADYINAENGAAGALPSHMTTVIIRSILRGARLPFWLPTVLRSLSLTRSVPLPNFRLLSGN